MASHYARSNNYLVIVKWNEDYLQTGVGVTFNASEYAARVLARSDSKMEPPHIVRRSGGTISGLVVYYDAYAQANGRPQNQLQRTQTCGPRKMRRLPCRN